MQRCGPARGRWFLVALGLVLAAGIVASQPLKIGFLAAESSLDAMGAHNRGAWETAAGLGEATLLLRQRDGSFADTNGTKRLLNTFDVVWYHQGDAIRRTAMYSNPSLGALRQFAENGGGVLLSGGALAMVAQLKLETEIRPQRHDLGNYRKPAGMIPMEKNHPAFSGLARDGDTVWLSRGGCRAVADFYWGGPGEGMILAKTPTGSENPLVEYTLGKGRFIVFGWHWPDYADQGNPHRGNLVSLTGNLLRYLATPKTWQPFVIRSEFPPVATPDQPGVSPARFRALRRAIEDLSATFPNRYSDGGIVFVSTAPFTGVPCGTVKALRRFVHTSTLESDAHLLPPRAFHADTSKLVQILRDGHYGVRMDPEAWDRLITWIDLNAPAHGTWQEVVGYLPDKAPLVKNGATRRRELNRRYAGIDEDPEAVYPAAVLTHVLPRAAVETHVRPPIPPRREPGPSPVVKSRRVPLAAGVDCELVWIPPGEFLMGCDNGYPNESPAHRVTLANGFWMGRCEVSNGEYGCFDPTHDSGLETGEQYAFGDYERGHLLNRPRQPVVRVSWQEAMAFCRWLSGKTGLRFSLPTEAQWEYACRAGTTGPLWYGTLDDDFSQAANLSDATHHTVDYPHVPTALPPWRPADTRFDDGWRVSAPVGTFAPNPWGLYDIHGNVAEWTRSQYGKGSGRRVVRGGSWRDRPRRARSAFRLYYAASQAVHDVGFRVVCEEPLKGDGS